MENFLILKTSESFQIGKEKVKFLVTSDTRKIKGDDDFTEFTFAEGNGIVKGEIETKNIEYLSIITKEKEVVLVNNTDIKSNENTEIINK